MPRGKGYGSKHRAGKPGSSRQFGQHRGNGRQRSGGPTSDKLYSKQMKDASSGRQRHHHRRSSDNPKMKRT